MLLLKSVLPGVFFRLDLQFFLIFDNILRTGHSHSRPTYSTVNKNKKSLRNGRFILSVLDDLRKMKQLTL